MTIELSTLARCTVKTVTWEPNAARTLEAEHHVKSDDPAALTVGDEVQYTDADLGLLFLGKIVSVERLRRSGEGIVYKCADNYRLLAKTAATVTAGGRRTGKLAFLPGITLQEAINKITAAVAAYFPGGIVITDLPGTLLALARYQQLGQAVDHTGAVNVHVKGFNTNLRLGSAITNFGQMRIRRITYDLYRPRFSGQWVSMMPRSLSSRFCGLFPLSRQVVRSRLGRTLNSPSVRSATPGCSAPRTRR